MHSCSERHIIWCLMLDSTLLALVCCNKHTGIVPSSCIVKHRQAKVARHTANCHCQEALLGLHNVCLTQLLCSRNAAVCADLAHNATFNHPVNPAAATQKQRRQRRPQVRHKLSSVRDGMFAKVPCLYVSVHVWHAQLLAVKCLPRTQWSCAYLGFSAMSN